VSEGRPLESAAGEVAARVAAVVVNYNTAELLVDCVASLRAEGIKEIVVVDNASVDDSRGRLAAADPAATFIPAGANRGYGAGANIGLRATDSELVLVGNADLVFEAGAIAALVAALDADPRRGLVGPRVLNRDGSVYPSVRTFPAIGDALGHAFLGLVAPSNRWSARYKMLDWDHSRAAEADWISGSCFLARREALDALGGFDEAYFMYSEDVDLCWRAWKRGWRVAYEPAAAVTHVQGASTDLRPYRMIAHHHLSLLRFAYRSTEGWRRALLPAVAAGLFLRTVLSAAQRAGEGARQRVPWLAGPGPGERAPARSRVG